MNWRWCFRGGDACEWRWRRWPQSWRWRLRQFGRRRCRRSAQRCWRRLERYRLHCWLPPLRARLKRNRKLTLASTHEQ